MCVLLSTNKYYTKLNSRANSKHQKEPITVLVYKVIQDTSAQAQGRDHQRSLQKVFIQNPQIYLITHMVKEVGEWLGEEGRPRHFNGPSNIRERPVIGNVWGGKGGGGEETRAHVFNSEKVSNILKQIFLLNFSEPVTIFENRRKQQDEKDQMKTHLEMN